MNLLAHALQVLSDPSNPTGLREAAAACLVAALEENLSIPPGTPAAIWSWIREATPKRWNAAQYRLGEVFDDGVFEAALEAVRDAASGSELRSVGIDVLAGSAYVSSLITDEMIEDLVDRLHVEPGRLAHLIVRVHRARRVPVDLLRTIRDRWASSTAPETRDASIEVGTLIPKPEEDFWSRMIDDPSEEVRISVIQAVARNARTPFAKKLIEDQMDREDSIDVRAELHQAMAALLQRGEGEGS